MFDRKIIKTKDGSHSILVEQMGETYHSVHGAVAEAEHVYIQNGIGHCPSADIAVLELGFGTGLNTLLTAQYALSNNIFVDYTTIEAHPLAENEWQALNYTDSPADKLLFEKIHTCEWGKKEEISDNFSLTKRKIFFEEMDFSSQFDVIYFDVFGYNYQPHLWSREILNKCFQALKPNGIWVTYACKGVVSRELKALGFTVKKLAGPPGKREMTQAVKIL